MAETPYPKLLSLLLVLLLLHFPFSASTIPLGSVLYASGSSQSWSSPNSTFSVSFLPSSPNSFLAAVSFAGNVPIWSAGSVDSRGSLRLDSSGSLRLISGSNTTVWSSGTDRIGVVSASIEDSGNLLLLNNRNITVWSSFDHSTDTIVQSQNFTVGKVIRSGLYSFQLERSGNLTLRWNNSITYWNRGLNSSFSSNLSSPSLGLQSNGVVSIFDPSLRGGAETIYSDDYGDGSSSFRFLKLDDDGNLRIYSSASRNSGPVSPHWSAVANQCLVYGYCGNFGICSYNEDTNAICSCPSLNFDPVDVNDRRKGCKRKAELSDCSGNITLLNLDHTSLFTYPEDPNSEVFFAGRAPCRYNCLVSGTCLASVSMSDGSGNCWQKQPGSFFTGYQSSSVLSTSYVKVCAPVLLINPPLIATQGNWKLKVILGVSAASVVIIIILVTIMVRAKKARKSGENFEAVVMLKRYSYAKVKKMTNSFAHVLGKGGFGTVYKGKLPDGKQDVAVKILKESEGNGEEFINEVASMSRTSHVNIVSLLGFCYEGNKRAIIYEFMPNGSLDKFISENMSTKMEWEKLNDIALGVSHGLEYLHNRCVSRIVHFDIKPQNILMDKDLCPKISDFGLAKLCKNKESIMSMLYARGTAGYIAPEVFSKNFGGVSHKSDVYSYGMVVLEMIGARNRENVEHSGSNNSSMYFPDWIYKDFDRGENMKIFGNQITEEEEKIAKKLVLIGLWCIQTNPSDRPPMIKVIEMLEGNLEALQVPPKPLWCLPAVTTVPETLEDSHETSSFSNQSQFDSGNSACEDALRFSKQVVQTNC